MSDDKVKEFSQRYGVREVGSIPAVTRDIDSLTGHKHTYVVTPPAVRLTIDTNGLLDLVNQHDEAEKEYLLRREYPELKDAWLRYQSLLTLYK